MNFVFPKELEEKGAPPFKATDYQLPTSKISVARIELSAPYPEEAHKFAYNTKSTMIVLICSGTVVLEHQGGQQELPAGSAVHIDINEWYRWVPKGVVVLQFSSAPAWTQEQQRIIEKP